MVRDFVALLSARAAEHPERVAVRVLGDGERETRTFTYADLHGEASRIAARLSELAQPGDRALLLYPSGVEYVTAFLGCLYAGVIAVPAYPPESLQPQHLGRLLSILKDSAPRVICTESGLEGVVRALASSLPEASGCAVLASDAAGAAPAAWLPPVLPPDAPAFLQYTSGSTASPKGVMVSHANILANEAAIQAAFALTESDVVVSWLPLFHDMGLIGCLLQPLYAGASLVLMSPQHFVSRPLRWLEAISRYRGTVGGGPNFGYRLVAEHVAKLQNGARDALGTLDLSSWRLAFCGAEPVRAETLARFAEATAPLGFDAQALYPCYGLAEATLFVTGGAPLSGVRTRRFSRDALGRGEARELSGGAPLSVDARAPALDAAVLVGLGTPKAGHRVRIADPETGSALPPGRVGEVQVRGPSVTGGYYRNAEATAAVLCAGDAGAWLRTGDLGFESDGHLYITGRRKDMIILRGQNVYAEDVEQQIEAAVEVVRRGRVVAFAVDSDAGESLAVMAELARQFEKWVEPEVACRAISEAVSAAYREPPLVVLVKAGMLPLTSSGKLQRAAAKRAWLAGDITPLHVFREGGTGVATRAPAKEVLSATEQRLAELWRTVLGGALPARADGFFARGGTSLHAVELVAAIERELGVELSAAAFEDPTLAGLARRIDAAPRRAARSELPVTPRPERLPLSDAERRIHFASRLDGGGAYNITAGVCIDGELRLDVLGRSLDALVARHEPLRSAYPLCDEAPERRIHTPQPVRVETLDLSALPSDARAARVAELEAREASTPFDLEAGPLLRVTAVRLGASEHRLVFGVHHIAADGRALDVLLDELTVLYAAGCGAPLAGRAPLEPLDSQYADYALAEHGAKSERVVERERALVHFRRALGDEHPLLELPADHPRPAVTSAASGHLDFALDAGELDALRAVARARGVTPFTLVLAAFQLTLQRLAGRPRQVRVGVPVLNRHGRAEQRMVGCFINTVVLATDFDGVHTFAELLERVRDVALAAQEHQRLPFEELVEALAPERSLAVSPLFQVMLSWRPEVAADTLALPGATLRREPPSDLLSKFDLTLHASELPRTLAFRLVYRSELFERATIERFRDALAGVLARVVAEPERRLDAIYAGPAADRARALGEWSPMLRAPRHASVQGWVREIAARWPDRRAVRGPDGELTYAALVARSGALASALAERGVAPGARVGLLLERSTDFVVALLAVLARGAAYVPLDPEAPAARLEELLADAGVVGVIEHAATARVLGRTPVWRLALEDVRRAAPGADAAALAEHPELPVYVLYTSGSTGRPKGVVVTQRGAVSYTEALLERVAASEDADQWALVSTLAADLGNTVLFGALCSGRCLHLLAKDTVFDPDAFAAYMSEHAIAVLKIVPSHLAGLLEASAPERALPRHALVLGGEASSWGLVDRIRALGACRIINHYGPTETTVGVLTFELEPTATRPLARTLPLGRPLANASVYVLDADGQPAPVGVAGEVYIGGHGLAQGYLARPGLTAERFVPDPFGVAGARLYRTGDRARYLADGCIEFLGRWDEQIKLRGYRIELGEIRARLRAQVGVSDALVRVLETGEGRERLVAYVVTQGSTTSVEALEQALAASLPEYMRPSDYVLLEAFPLTNNGKIDTRALPLPAQTSDQSYVAPRSEAERVLARVWRELLGVERVGVRDNFFKLGGDSITTLQVVARARRLGVDLSPKQLFEHQTIESAARAARLVGAASDPARNPGQLGGEPALACANDMRRAAAQSAYAPVRRPRGELPQREDFPLAGLSEDDWRALPVAHDRIEDIFPLSPMQQGMLLHTLLEPGSGIYLMQDHYRVERGLDAERFVEAWRRVIVRHAALRASFVWQREENMLQIIHRDVAPYAVESFDWSELEPAAQERELERFFAEERRQGYDLGQTGNFRIRLFKLGAERYHFVQSRHHILLDAWCRSLLLVDFFQLYRELTEGVPAELSSAPEYRDFIGWLGTHDRDALRGWWKDYLSGFDAANSLSVARPLPRGGRISAVVDAVTFLSESETTLFNASARSLGVTPNTMAQAAWALVLGQYSGQRDLVFGVTVAGRPAELEGVQDTVGLFINTLPLRVALPAPGSTLSVERWLESLQAQNVALRQHEQLSLVEIQAESVIARGEQLFHSLFVFENAPLDRSLEAWGKRHEITFGAHRTHTNYPATVVVIPGKQAKLIISYDERLFDARDVERMLACYRDMLLWLAEHPEAPLGGAPRLSGAELEAQAEWNRTEREYPLEAGYAALFEAQVASHGERVAVRCGQQALSYRELDGRAEAIGVGLRAVGVGTDQVVGVYSERGVGFIASVIGVFKAGGAYVPLDPKHPEARMLEVLSLSKARVVVTSAGLEGRLRAALEGLPGGEKPRVLVRERLEGEPAGVRLERLPVHGAQLAYVIYTSGSTGKPKGAMVTMAGMLNNQLSKVPFLGLGASDVIGQTASQSFDISVWQNLAALLCGATVEVVLDEVAQDAERLLGYVRERGITVLESVPSLIGGMLALDGDEGSSGSSLGALRVLMPTGEALLPELARQWLRRYPSIPLVNAYGPAECADDVSLWRIAEPPAVNVQAVPIGRATDNNRLYVLDSSLERVAIGVVGEVCVAGVGVGRGYLGDAGRTAEVFVPNPYGEAGERLYRTGDLARLGWDGALEYVGRRDQQVKVRGYRIELGEIEARLATLPGVRAAAVLALGGSEGGAGGRRLVAYVVPERSDAAPERDDERAIIARMKLELSRQLPDYMVPTQWQLLAELPLSPNGKLDRKALPEPDAHGAQRSYTAPSSDAERTLAAIWQVLLRVDRVGRDDNFFELGGDSIMALQLVSRAKRAGLALAPRDVFEHPTLAELALGAQPGAARVGDLDANERVAAAALADGAAADANIPLLPSQRWFFAQAGAAPAHFNQSVLLELPASLEPARLERALAALVRRHPGLLHRFEKTAGGWRQSVGAAPARILETLDLSHEAEPLAALEREASRAQRGLDLERGPVFRALHVRLGDEDGDRLLLIAHHLVVDAVAWRVLVEDLEAAHADPQALSQRPASASLAAAVRALAERAQTPELLAEQPWYETQLGGEALELPSRHPDANNTAGDTRTLRARLSTDETQKLLGAAGRAYRTQVSDLLLTALAETFCGWSGQPSLRLQLGAHGRHDVGVDVSRCVGWFAATHPLRLTPRLDDRASSIKSIKEQLRAVPAQGAGYAALRWLSPAADSLAALERSAPTRVGFNYFGNIPAASPGGLLRWSDAPRGEERAATSPRDTWFDVGARVLGDSLEVSLRYGSRLHDTAEASALLERYMATLRELLEHCLSPHAGGVTPSDFPLIALTQAELDALDVPPRNIEDIYPLSPMQQGMLVHTLLEPGSGIYVMQEHFRFDSAMDVDAFMSAWRAVGARHAPLRTSFAWQAEGQMMQIVQRRLPPPVQYLDWADQSPEQQRESLDALVKTEQQSGFDLGRAPLVRFCLIRFGAKCYYFIKSYHHILIDGWCSSLLLVEFFERYRALTEGTRLELASPPPYRDFIAWLGRKDPAESAAYWRSELEGFTSCTPIPIVAPLAAGAGVSRVAEEVLYLTAGETDRLLRAAQQCRLTPNTFAQAAWALVLSQYSGQREVLFGVTVAGRPAELEGVQDTIGLFINTIPLRTTLPEPSQGLSVGEWLTALLRQNVTMRQHEHVPLVEIQSRSELPRGQRLFDSLFVFENAPLDASLMQRKYEFRADLNSHRTHTNYPLTVVVIPGKQAKLLISYDERLCATRDVSRMLRHYRDVLLWLAEHPEAPLGRSPRLSGAELEAQAEWNRTEREYPLEAGYAALFEAQVASHGERVAVRCGQQALSYRELDACAEAIGVGLRAAGVSTDQVVGVYSERGVGFIASVIGAFKAGGAYVPLDPKHPEARMLEVLSLSKARVVVTSAELEGRLRAALEGLPDGEKPQVLVRERLEGEPAGVRLERLPVHGAQLAYVIYTSGSTGKPKGAMVTMAGMLNNQLSKVPFLGLGASDVIGQTASQSFDISVWQNLAALLCGATVEVVLDEVAQDAERLLGYVRERGITVLESVPSLIGGMLALDGDEGSSGSSLGALRVLMPTGEALLPELARQWLRRYPSIPLVNAYGPAECADDVSLWRIAEPPAANVQAVPIGRATDNNRLYVLDSSLERVAIGVVGEVCVAGVGVGRGYLGDAGRTAEVFVPNPYGEAGERLYRTGDLARLGWDGALEYVGRRDQQVKVRGYRIELGEIEARLATLPGVRAAAVAARPGPGSGQRLIGYVVPEAEHAPGSNARPLIAELEARLGRQLPEYMVPRQWVLLGELPLGATGKLDRNALPEPDASQAQRAHTPPATPAERTLAAIWQNLLRVERVGQGDDFFELGGDSIIALQLVSRAKREGLIIAPRDVFEQPKLAALARVAEPLEAGAAGAAPNDATPDVSPLIDEGALVSSDGPLVVLSDAEIDALGIPRDNIEDIYPLSPMQQGMLVHTLMEPGSGMYLMQEIYHFDRAVDPQAFVQAWDAVVARHATLRASFNWQLEGKMLQIVQRQIPSPVQYIDLGGLEPDEQRRRIRAIVQDELHHGFDLARAPLLALRLIRCADESFYFIESYHHILIDGWCSSLILVEFFARYRALCAGEPLELGPAPRYRDFIAWLGRHDRQAFQRYWRQELSGFTERTPLGILRPLAQDAGVSRVYEEILYLSREQTERLVRAAQLGQVTPNTLAQAAWALVLSQYGGRREVLFGVTVAGRPTELPAAEETVGLFINTIPLRTTLPDPARLTPVRQWLSALLRQNLVMRQHEHVPLLEIQALGELPRGQRLFDSLVVFENAPLDASLNQRKLDLSAELTSQRTHTNYPLTVVVTPGPEVELRFSYDLRLFDPKDIRRMLEHYRDVVLWLAEHPEQPVHAAPRLNAAERLAQAEWNRTQRQYPLEAGYAALFEAQVQSHGERVAVRSGDEAVTYRQLDARAEAIGRGLRAAELGADQLAGVYSERGIGFIASVIGAFKLGGAYVPLDPKHPEARMLEVLSLSKAGVVVTSAALEGRLRAALEALPPDTRRPRVLVREALEAGAPGERLPPAPVHPEQLAYVIYTSGSTGKPKGAMVTMAGMLNNQLSKVPFLGLGASDVIAQTASQSFDISVWQNLAALLCGAQVEVVLDEIAQDAAALLGYVKERGITLLESVPSLIGGMLALEGEAGVSSASGASAAGLGALRVLMPTGEALLPELARQWLRRYPSIPLVNAYGPAECADDVSLWRIEEPPPPEVLAVPIGRATDNNRLYVLDSSLDPVAIGVVGEVCVAGVGVGRGYLGDAARTAEAFVPNPHGAPGERLYRTGDLGRLAWDGALEYVGRRDQQVKVRGYRIELGEIEARLRELPGLREAVVLARPDAAGRGQRLVAYVVPAAAEADERTRIATWKAALARQLPEYMVPAQWLLLAELPLGPNGKIDRKALPESEAHAAQQAFVPPATDIERALAQIWEQLLRAQRVGLDDDFFELGGDSIVALQLVGRAKRAGLALAPRAVFEHPTLGALARVASRLDAAPVHAQLAPVAGANEPSGDVPLLPIQHWFFEQSFENKHHWNQSALLTVPLAIDLDALGRALSAVADHHPAFRLRFEPTEQGYRQFYGPAVCTRLERFDLTREHDPIAALEREANRVQRSLDLERGPLARFVLFSWADERRVLVVMHHLISDTVSWRILFEDWHQAYVAFGRGEPAQLEPVPTSYQRWSRLVREHARSPALRNELGYWRQVLGGERQSLPAREPDGDNRVKSTRTLSVTLNEATTHALLHRAPRHFGTQINDLLLSALALAMCRWSGQAALLVELEGHGRENLFDGVDLSRTVGWFTSPQMVRLEPVPGDLPASIRAIRAQLRRAPHHGLGYAITRYLTEAGQAMASLPFPQVFFNYLGQFDQLFDDPDWLSPASEPRGDERCPDSSEDAWFGAGGVVHGGRLRLDFRYSVGIHDEATARQLVEQFAAQLRDMVRLCGPSAVASAPGASPAGAE